MRLRLEVVLDDVAAAIAVRLVHLEPAVEPAGTNEGRVEHVRAVRRPDHEHDGLGRHRAADHAEPASDLVSPAVFDVLTERVHLVEHGVEPHPAHAHHPAHHSLLLPALDAAARHADGVELVDEEDRGARRPRQRVLAGEAARFAEQRHDDEGVHAEPHAGEARRVDVDEGQVRLGRDNAGEEGLARPGLAGEQHPTRHLAAELHELLDAAEDPDGALRVLEEVRLAAVVLERQADLRAVRRHRVGARARQEPHEPGELRDPGDEQEDELDDELRHRRDELADSLPQASQSDHQHREEEDHEQDDEPSEVVMQDVRGRSDE